MAKSLKGPWIAPDDDAFDGRAYYAGRTFMLNNQRILFGWVPTRANETDSANLWYRPEADKEDFIWAGTFVAHELYQREDGTLGCRIPDTVWNAFQSHIVHLRPWPVRRFLEDHTILRAFKCERIEFIICFLRPYANGESTQVYRMAKSLKGPWIEIGRASCRERVYLCV